MKQVPAIIVGFALVCLLCGACLVAVVDYSDHGASPGEEVNRVLPFAAGGRLSLRNYDGEIRIAGWGEEEIDVSALTWRAPRDRTSVTFMKRNIPGAPRVEIEEREGGVRIRTLAPERSEEDVIVDYEISVPHSVDLNDITARDGLVHLQDIYGEARVELRVGEIQADNFSGSLDASLMEGSIQADLYDLRESDRVRLKVREGDIFVILDPDADVTLEGYCPDGDVTTDFEFDQPGEKDRFTSEIGDGGAVINLSVLVGNITIERRR